MGIKPSTKHRLRERLKAERERRNWSIRNMVTMLGGQGVTVYPSTICKIESGDRVVQVDELIAYSEVFGISVDGLLELRPGRSDLVWAMSKLTSNAQKIAGDVATLGHRLSADSDDVWASSNGTESEALDRLLELADEARRLLRSSSEALNRLANQFPIPVN